MTFEHGFHQAYGTIEDCVGRNTSPVALLLLYPKIRRLQEHRELLIAKPEVHEDENEEFEGAHRGEQRRANDLSTAISTLSIVELGRKSHRSE